MSGLSPILPSAGEATGHLGGPHTGLGEVRGLEAGLTETHLWLKGGSRHQSRRRDKLRNFDWLGCGGGGLHLRQNHSRCGSVQHFLLLLHMCVCRVIAHAGSPAAGNHSDVAKRHRSHEDVWDLFGDEQSPSAAGQTC